MTMIIIGASGYIGAQLLENAPHGSWGTATSHHATGLVEFDFSRPTEFPWDRLQSRDVIVVMAAISSPDICAREHDHARAVNVTGTIEFISEVMARGGRVIFFSSDTVYGERNDEFDEGASCNPAGEYAEMKREVEDRFLGNPLFKVVRLSYVFSRADKFTKYLYECAERDEEVEVFHPFYRAIIHRDDVIDGVLALSQQWAEFPQPIINFGGPKVLSRIEFAEIMQETAMPGLKFRVTEPEPVFFKNRPKVIRMKSPILAELLERPSRSLLEAAQIEFALS